jgi:predicted metal-dependent phosphotriesterase family hydrolase
MRSDADLVMQELARRRLRELGTDTVIDYKAQRFGRDASDVA